MVNQVVMSSPGVPRVQTCNVRRVSRGFEPVMCAGCPEGPNLSVTVSCTTVIVIVPQERMIKNHHHRGLVGIMREAL